MTPEQHAAWDEATILCCRATSPAAYLARVDHEERLGLSPYPNPGRLLWTRRVCAAPDCLRSFEPYRTRRYCSAACQTRAASRRYEARHHTAPTAARLAVRLEVVRDRVAS